MRKDFAVFICTHGRPNAQLTLATLKSCGYTGEYFLVVDDTDNTIQQYIDNFGADRVIVFNKNYYINSDRFDNGDNKLHAKCILYAKRAVEDIAKEYGYKYFIIADDDITKLNIRYPIANKLCRISINDIDSVLSSCIEYLETANLVGLGFGNVVHYFGGINSPYLDFSKKWVLPYQLVLRNGNITVDWLSWFAEDDVTEYQSCMLGNVWLAFLYVMYEVKPVGVLSASGGMVETYRNDSLYALNFNAVKYCPQRMSLRTHRKDGHIVIDRNDAISFPKVISGRYKK